MVSPLYVDNDVLPKNLSEVTTHTKKLQNFVSGYSDGTVRVFDLSLVEMILKMQPHAVAVTAITYSSDR